MCKFFFSLNKLAVNDYFQDDSVFIEGKYFADKLASGSILDDCKYFLYHMI